MLLRSSIPRLVRCSRGRVRGGRQRGLRSLVAGLIVPLFIRLHVRRIGGLRRVSGVRFHSVSLSPGPEVSVALLILAHKGCGVACGDAMVALRQGTQLRTQNLRESRLNATPCFQGAQDAYVGPHLAEPPAGGGETSLEACDAEDPRVSRLCRVLHVEAAKLKGKLGLTKGAIRDVLGEQPQDSREHLGDHSFNMIVKHLAEERRVY